MHPSWNFLASLLPAYCRGFDVGMIPFRKSDLTLRANPLKLREYLAAGLPVVSTPLPEVARYRTLVHLAEGATGFAQAIAAALGERSPASDRARAAAMGAESWEARVEEIEGHIDRTARRAALPASPNSSRAVAGARSKARAAGSNSTL